MEEVLHYLYRKEIVFIKTKQAITYFAYQENRFIAKSNQATYYVDEVTLVDLFKQETFYLHKRQKEESQEDAILKDKEYYSWTHK